MITWTNETGLSNKWPLQYPWPKGNNIIYPSGHFQPASSWSGPYILHKHLKNQTSQQPNYPLSSIYVSPKMAPSNFPRFRVIGRQREIQRSMHQKEKRQRWGCEEVFPDHLSIGFAHSGFIVYVGYIKTVYPARWELYGTIIDIYRAKEGDMMGISSTNFGDLGMIGAPSFKMFQESGWKIMSSPALANDLLVFDCSEPKILAACHVKSPSKPCVLL